MSTAYIFAVTDGDTRCEIIGWSEEDLQKRVLSMAEDLVDQDDENFGIDWDELTEMGLKDPEKLLEALDENVRPKISEDHEDLYDKYVEIWYEIKESLETEYDEEAEQENSIDEDAYRDVMDRMERFVETDVYPAWLDDHKEEIITDAGLRELEVVVDYEYSEIEVDDDFLTEGYALDVQELFEWLHGYRMEFDPSGHPGAGYIYRFDRYSTEFAGDGTMFEDFEMNSDLLLRFVRQDPTWAEELVDILDDTQEYPEVLDEVREIAASVA